MVVALVKKIFLKKTQQSWWRTHNGTTRHSRWTLFGTPCNPTVSREHFSRTPTVTSAGLIYFSDLKFSKYQNSLQLLIYRVFNQQLIILLLCPNLYDSIRAGISNQLGCSEDTYRTVSGELILDKIYNSIAAVHVGELTIISPFIKEITNSNLFHTV